jgi:hypothetical protein
MRGARVVRCIEDGTLSPPRLPWCVPRAFCQAFMAPERGSFINETAGRLGGSGLVRAGDGIEMTCEPGWCVRTTVGGRGRTAEVEGEEGEEEKGEEEVEEDMYMVQKVYKRMCGANSRWTSSLPTCVGNETKRQMWPLFQIYHPCMTILAIPS